MEDLFDVLEIGIRDGRVRGIISSAKTLKNAEAIEALAVRRRGVLNSFFALARAESHAVGDEFDRHRP